MWNILFMDIVLNINSDSNDICMKWLYASIKTIRSILNQIRNYLIFTYINRKRQYFVQINYTSRYINPSIREWFKYVGIYLYTKRNGYNVFDAKPYTSNTYCAYFVFDDINCKVANMISQSMYNLLTDESIHYSVCDDTLNLFKLNLMSNNKNCSYINRFNRTVIDFLNCNILPWTSINYVSSDLNLDGTGFHIVDNYIDLIDKYLLTRVNVEIMLGLCKINIKSAAK